MTYNLNTAHRAYGGLPTTTPAKFLASPRAAALMKALGIERDAGNDQAPAELITAYLAWLSPHVMLALVRGQDVSLSAYRSIPGEAPARNVTGRLAGIDLLEPGQALRIAAPGHAQASLRAAVHNLGIRLDRRLSVSIHQRDKVATITRLADVVALPPVIPAAPAPRRPDGWIDFDPANEQHAAWGSREAFDAAQTEALNAKNSADIDWT